MQYIYTGWTVHKTRLEISEMVTELSRFIDGQEIAIKRHTYASDTRQNEARERIHKAGLVRAKLVELAKELSDIDESERGMNDG